LVKAHIKLPVGLLAAYPYRALSNKRSSAVADHTMLRVIEYFAKSLNATECLKFVTNVLLNFVLFSMQLKKSKKVAAPRKRRYLLYKGDRASFNVQFYTKTAVLNGFVQF